MDQKFDLDDVLIVPASVTYIFSRFENNIVDPFYDNGCYPLMTAPMDTVVNENNYKLFLAAGINVALPRTVKNKSILNVFNSFSLKEFQMEFLDKNSSLIDTERPYYVLIDIANGHMLTIINAIKESKAKYGKNIKIMAGNIANPDTLYEYHYAGADYARIGIGNGNGCLTTQQTGIGYPMGSLISECYKIKKYLKSDIKIVADGGMKKYADIIKALALGADFVMIGSILNKTLESCSPSFYGPFKLSDKFASKLYEWGLPLHKEFRGMSTKAVQKVLGNKILRTSEGVVKKQKVEYTVSQWIKNLDHYLRSNMSYSDANDLSGFIGNPKWNLITTNALNRFNK